MAPKKNGFFYFMLEVQRREQEKGVSCTRAAAQVLADPLWKAMSAEEKQRYQAMAKRGNESIKNDLSQKFTSLGVSFATIDSEERSKTESMNLMATNIKSSVRELHGKDRLKSHPFFLAHVNFYYRTEDNYFAPAEFALVVFSFEMGRIDTLHFFIHIGKIPLGYKYHAQDWSQRVHGIPFMDSNFKEALTDYEEMFWMVDNFIKKYSPDKMPPIYTMSDSLTINYSDSAVQCAFDNMCQAAKVDSSMFKVYHLDKLFHEIITVIRPNEFCSSALMRNELEKDPFSYARDLGCYFHEESDLLLNCSLSIAVRWVYTMCDHCCKRMNIKLMLGYHVPADVDVNWKKGATQEHRTLTFVEQQERDQKADECASEASVRPPKTLFSQKIGATFDPRLATSTATKHSEPSSQDSGGSDDSDWALVERGKTHGLGRGRAIPQYKPSHQLPSSGRGRLASLRKD